jgi:hypothetical protein
MRRAKPTHLIVQKGRRRGKVELTLPLSAVERVEGDTVYLKLDKKAIEQLPALPRKRRYEQGEANVELVARVFKDPDKDNEQLARKALDYVEELHKSQTIQMLDAALLVRPGWQRSGGCRGMTKKDACWGHNRWRSAASPGGAIVRALVG